MVMLKFIKFCIKSREAQDQQCRHLEIVKAKEELAKKNQEILQHHSLLNETEQLLVCWAADFKRTVQSVWGYYDSV